MGAKTAGRVGHGAIGEVVEGLVKRGIRAAGEGVSKAIADFHRGTAQGLKVAATRTREADARAARSFKDLEHSGRNGVPHPRSTYGVQKHLDGSDGSPARHRPPKAAEPDLIRSLSASERQSFESARVRHFPKGHLFYRSEAAGASNPGRFLGTRQVVTRGGAESQYNVVKWGNPREVLRTYRLRQGMSLAYGRVAGGKGFQALLPRGVDPLDVLELVGEEPLR